MVSVFAGKASPGGLLGDTERSTISVQERPWARAILTRASTLSMMSWS